MGARKAYSQLQLGTSLLHSILYIQQNNIICICNSNSIMLICEYTNYKRFCGFSPCQENSIKWKERVKRRSNAMTANQQQQQQQNASHLMCVTFGA